jgi:two-component system, NtrC family, sensor kinase
MALELGARATGRSRSNGAPPGICATPGAGRLTKSEERRILGFLARNTATLSLRVRILLLLALSGAGLVVIATVWQLRITGAAVERELLDAAAAAALGVAGELDERPARPGAAELEDIRSAFAQAVPELQAISVTRLGPRGHRLDASTDAAPPRDLLELAERATRAREVVVSELRPGALRLVAVPLERDRQPYGAVVVSMSVERVERLRREIRVGAATIAPLASLALMFAIWLVSQRLIHRPLESIRDTMSRAAGGDLESRARVFRPDELGALAAGLNGMLDRMRDFNATLQSEVARATAELRDRNRLLAESLERLFAARRELARAEQLAVAGQMAASVAHQIGTPLNLVSGYVQMLLEEAPAGSAREARLRSMHEQIARVTAGVQSLLDRARTPVLHRGRVDPAELVARSASLARATLERSGLALETRIEPALPAVDVDAGQIEQALLNLIANAMDATPAGGTLTLAARARDGAVEIVVADSGAGISREDAARVFDPLFTTKPPGRGTGLGLTIVRDVLEAHGGSVILDSEPGRGTTVTLRLPAAGADGGDPRHA